ncbi:MAG TPA: 2-amino-4-hydroxy-6-hydroxymethyldihydropteridine diphosphokinase [Pyrinomonadaceae bacterium]|jgi:2-amino-4-hydroxy-6-hydroxymethyldihydropteridine diphosphokinase|nr:2-amino-4-hydroxy-6-hydroxymethyldihydropteridine diphosphokinase [Pyrinomonadaceae bacterium]
MLQPPINATAYISLGSNLGDRAGNLLFAVRDLIAVGLEVTRLSQIYETEPVETFPQPFFLNMVAELRVEPATEPETVMKRLLQVENSLGRVRDTVKGPRTIDLDLLLYGEEIRNTGLLTLPHPCFHLRRFVLVPLAELAPVLVHPVLERTIDELLDKLEDSSRVEVWRPQSE